MKEMLVVQIVQSKSPKDPVPLLQTSNPLSLTVPRAAGVPAIIGLHWSVSRHIPCEQQVASCAEWDGNMHFRNWDFVLYAGS